MRGHARITGPGEVTVGQRVFSARRGIVVATGTSPALPPIPELADLPVWTNRDAVQVEQPPHSLIVIGGGAIGVEFAQVFARFGFEVTIVEAAPHLLPAEESEAGAVLGGVLEDEGLAIRTGTVVTALTHGAHGFDATLGDGSRLTAERVLVATAGAPG